MAVIQLFNLPTLYRTPCIFGILLKVVYYKKKPLSKASSFKGVRSTFYFKVYLYKEKFLASASRWVLD